MPLHRGRLRKRNPPLHRSPTITIPHPPIRHLCMTVITVDTGDFIAVITIPLPNNRFEQQKGGTGRFPPFFNLLCRLGSALIARMFRGRLAPQERCAQLWFSSKPGGVMSPPELLELSSLMYSLAALFASEDCSSIRFRFPAKLQRKKKAGHCLPLIAASFSSTSHQFSPFPSL